MSKLNVTDMTVSETGRVITLAYTRAPEPDEEMDARDWANIRARFERLAKEQIAKHGRDVEVYGSAPECEDWMIASIEA